MAKVVVFCRDNTHNDSIIDNRDCYKNGDIVSVYSDDFQVPSGIKPPLFNVFNIEGTKESLEYLIMTDDIFNIPVGIRHNPAVLSKLLSSDNKQQKRVRRYQYNNGVMQKCL